MENRTRFDATPKTKFLYLRNQILYASSEGIPTIADPIDGYILKRRDVIFTNLIIYLLIDPYKEKQLFVQQALSAFLKMLRLIPEDIDFG